MRGDVVTLNRPIGPDPVRPMHQQLQQELAELEQMDLKALKQRWAELSAHPLPSPLIHSP